MSLVSHHPAIERRHAFDRLVRLSCSATAAEIDTALAQTLCAVHLESVPTAKLALLAEAVARRVRETRGHM